MKKKRFSEEKMVSILREADSGDKTIVELCRRHGISDGATVKCCGLTQSGGLFFYSIFEFDPGQSMSSPHL